MQKFTTDQSLEALKDLEGKWIFDKEKNTISLSYKCSSFPSTVLFVNAVAHIAEQLNHHPEILINYRDVTFTLTTHDVKGLSSRDFELAHQIESLMENRADGSAKKH